MLRLVVLLFFASFYIRDVAAGCDVLRTRSSGEIQSVNYPDSYLNDHQCDYTITTEPGSIIRLTFQAFVLDSYYWCGDKLQIHDGDNINATMVGMFCGETLPPEIRSSHNSLFLRFTTNFVRSSSGFLANYSTILLTAPSVTNVSVTSVSSSSVLVHWKGLSSPFTVDNYTVAVKQLARRHSPPPVCPALPPLHSAITVTVNGSTTETAINLPADLEFQVVVTSITSAGLRGVPSDIVTGHTLPTASEAVRDLSVEFAADTVNFTWKAPCDSGGVLSHFLVELEADGKLQNADNYILNRTVGQPLEECYSISITLSKLTAESMYNVRVIPVGLHGLYGSNQIASFHVPARVPTQLQNVLATALSSSSVRVQWDPAAKSYGVIANYTVRVQPITRPRAFAPPLQTYVVNVSRSILQTDVSNLMADTLYQVTVTASTAAGQGPPSEPSLVQIPSEEEVPTQPQDVLATALSTSAVHVQWEPPSQSHGTLTYYIVTMVPLTGTNSTVPPTNSTVVTVAGTTLKTDIDHLLPGTEYQTVVTAATRFGQGPPSTPSVVITPPEDEGKLLLALEILRSSYIKSRDLLCSADPRSKENEYQHVCPPTS